MSALDFLRNNGAHVVFRVARITTVTELLPKDCTIGDVYVVDGKHYVWNGFKWEHLEKLPEEEGGESDEQQ